MQRQTAKQRSSSPTHRGQQVRVEQVVRRARHVRHAQQHVLHLPGMAGSVVGGGWWVVGGGEGVGGGVGWGGTELFCLLEGSNALMCCRSAAASIADATPPRPPWQRAAERCSACLTLLSRWQARNRASRYIISRRGGRATPRTLTPGYLRGA